MDTAYTPEPKKEEPKIEKKMKKDMTKEERKKKKAEIAPIKKYKILD